MLFQGRTSIGKLLNHCYGNVATLCNTALDLKTVEPVKNVVLLNDSKVALRICLSDICTNFDNTIEC